MFRSDRRSLLSLVAAATLLAATFSPAARTASSAAARSSNADGELTQAEAMLNGGKALLRRNRADEALPQLEAALALYARAGDSLGAAAARDAVGDIYQRQGQHAVALGHYRPAYEAFRAQSDCANAALLAVKIGETHYLAGDAAAASAAFARAGECEPKGGAGGFAAAGGASAGGDDSRRRRGAAFALVSASLLSLASCAALSPGQLANNSANNAANNAAAAANVVANVAASGIAGNAGGAGAPANNPGPSGGRPGTNNPGGRNPGANNPGSQSPGSNNTGANNPSGNNPAGNNPAGNNPSGNNPTGNNPTGNNPAGDGPSNSNPSGNKPTGDKPSNNKPSNDKPSNNKPSGNNSAPNEPPNRGVAPKKLDDLGRMDLRVSDQNGNPVKDVKARLSTRRPNGIDCDCFETTDATGRAVLPAIHVGKQLLLELDAKGFEPQKIVVSPQDLAKPYRVTMYPKGVSMNPKGVAPAAARSAARGEMAHGVSRGVIPVAAAQSGGQVGGAGQCLDLFRLFVAYGSAELGAARADFNAGRLDSARAHYENVLAVAGADSPAGSLLAARLLRAVSRTSLGDIAFRQGRFAEAAALYSQAADGARRDDRPELAWAAQRGLARSLWAQAAQQPSPDAAKKREEALQTYRAALSTVETLFNGSLRADEARTNFLSTTRDLFEDAASALAESALSAQGPARPQAYRVGAHAYQPPARPLEGRALAYAAEAFRVVEQGRARSLLDLIGESRAEITAGLPAGLVARRAGVRARQQEIADALRGVRAPGDRAPAQSVAQLEAELDSLSVEHDAIENGIRTASPRYRALVRAQPLTLAEVQQQVLDEGTALLEYSLGRERSYLFALTRAGLTVERLPARAAIEEQAAELRRHLIPAGSRRAIAGVDVTRGIGEELEAQAAGRGLAVGNAAAAPQVVAAYAAAAHALYRTVLAPAAPFVGARRLLVVAEGALNYVPFEALVTAPGGLDYPGLNYLVNTHEVVYAPSASVVAAVRGQSRAGASRAGGVLVVADPVFDAGDARARARDLKTKGAAAQRAALQSALSDVTSLKAAGLKLARLAGTRAEAEQIAALARAEGGAADLWLDFDASEANVLRRELSRYRVLHFATHGLLDSERPQFTGIALSLVGDADADGFLRTDEIFNLKLGAPLVMLSACETGLGREKRGEGVIGLTRAFMYAGAPTVGVSLWSVGDKSTAELMPDFYRRLLAAQGREPAAAMRAAQQAMIASKRYSAPFYWAPFVLVGDWQ